MTLTLTPSTPLARTLRAIKRRQGPPTTLEAFWRRARETAISYGASPARAREIADVVCGLDQ